MIDLIGMRRYGYLLSGVLVLVGLLFTLATLIPNGNIGLQFSIAYTGGTVWEVHFEEGAPDPVSVRAVLEEQGLSGEVAITEADDREYVLIRTDALLQEPELAEGSAAAAAAAERDAAAGASASPEAGDEAAPSASPEGSPQPADEASAEPVASPLPEASPSREPDASPMAEAEASVEPAASSLPGPETSAEPVASPLPEADASADPGASPLPDASASPDPAAAAAAAAGDDGPTLPTEGQIGALATALQEEFGPIDEVRQENSVGPVVSQELIWQTLTLVLFAALAIMLWVAYRFRDFRMGVTALAALLHDVIITVGTFAVLGTFMGLQVDALFVTAMLTVIGFSVHDTIVVFDRIRENRHRYLGEQLEGIVNFSLVQTFGRSVTTSLTLVVTLLALLLFGGEAIRPFTFALLIGVVAGTYSSLFVATPLFLDWHLWADERTDTSLSKAKVDTSAA